ncbi:SPX (SYG1/Pho81/XPR1) domain-containing protein [Striga asiatica]|uniref:SPX (SYG1/Pho81/XPR1) domain-containing protein n=1 Tax=Striga asiatica TaxID=4170 RepID=A0A5A7PPY1_STRAF|nr:SPX (SYG1/Pho81/XPR1) domain-containing protein [Striga asiatica]
MAAVAGRTHTSRKSKTSGKSTSDGSPRMLEHNPLQHCHVKGQRIPQRPQLLGSEVTSTQRFWQQHRRILGVSSWRHIHGLWRQPVCRGFLIVVVVVVVLEGFSGVATECRRRRRIRRTVSLGMKGKPLMYGSTLIEFGLIVVMQIVLASVNVRRYIMFNSKLIHETRKNLTFQLQRHLIILPIERSPLVRFFHVLNKSRSNLSAFILMPGDNSKLFSISLSKFSAFCCARFSSSSSSSCSSSISEMKYKILQGVKVEITICTIEPVSIRRGNLVIIVKWTVEH